MTAMLATILENNVNENAREGECILWKKLCKNIGIRFSNSNIFSCMVAMLAAVLKQKFDEDARNQAHIAPAKITAKITSKPVVV